MVAFRLPANKTYSLREARWELLPISFGGILTVEERQKPTTKPRIRRYFVKVVDHPEPGELVFEFRKPLPDEELHRVCIRTTAYSECTCRGYESGGTCTHIQALQELGKSGKTLR